MTYPCKHGVTRYCQPCESEAANAGSLERAAGRHELNYVSAFCPECERGNHGRCWRTQPSHPPGSYGGSKCRCGCDGDSNYDKWPNGVLELGDGSTRPFGLHDVLKPPNNS